MFILLRILGSLLGDLLGAFVKVPIEVAAKLGILALIGAVALTYLGHDPIAMVEQYLYQQAVNRLTFW